MYHDVSYGLHGTYQDHKQYFKEVKMIKETYDNLMLERTNLDKNKLAEVCRNKYDFFFSAKQAVEFGVADEILKKKEIEIQTEEK